MRFYRGCYRAADRLMRLVRAKRPAARSRGRAACDFELLRADAVWGAKVERDNIPTYPANRMVDDVVLYDAYE